MKFAIFIRYQSEPPGKKSERRQKWCKIVRYLKIRGIDHLQSGGRLEKRGVPGALQCWRKTLQRKTVKEAMTKVPRVGQFLFFIQLFPQSPQPQPPLHPTWTHTHTHTPSYALNTTSCLIAFPAFEKSWKSMDRPPPASCVAKGTGLHTGRKVVSHC